MDTQDSFSINTFVKFSELNLGAKFDLKASLTDGYYNNASPRINLGCHVGLLSNMYLRLDKSSVAPLDATKSSKKESNDFGESYGWLNKYIKKVRLAEEEKVRIWTEVVHAVCGERQPEHPRGFSFIFLSDNMNSYSEVFPNNSGLSIGDALPMFKTSDFVNWLIAEKIGVVVASPIARNQYHQQGSENFSMTQAFIWMPPHFCPTAAPNTAFMSNLSSLPSESEWRRQVKIKCNTDLDEKLWRDGKSLINRADVAI